MTRVLLSFGGNLGDPVAVFRDALAALGDAVVKVSPVYETPPWGDADQPPYRNAVVLADRADLDPEGWLTLAQELENTAGRVRDPARRFGPRTLDVDIIAAWDESGEAVTSDDERLTLPHPRAHLRAFVLVPWSKIEPEAVLPGHGRIAGLLTDTTLAADARQVTPTGEALG
ncbi:2-amino-4-hydroxy-6-hydroxymethyldihydropteridine diphosphokinase [Phytomonospora sp. NPDC050363]|uniref:2-amino-4-hydroxy-6- hydroxymethyldihydropteridine diphosphokinase n=1 Tax=Phytomonospora sp. NPDC050363 TaxID=3155642 RepID=UPI0033D2DA71